MEKGRVIKLAFVLMLLSLPFVSVAQTSPQCTVENGKMVIRVPENFTESVLDSLLSDFNLEQKEFRLSLASGNWSYFEKLGWKIKERNRKGIVLSKEIQSSGDNESNFWTWDLKPKTSLELQPGIPFMTEAYGVNRFEKKPGVITLNDSMALFILRGKQDAQQVYLSGSFNNWSVLEEKMTRTDSGWVAVRSMKKGKHLYKFIVDGKWKEDSSNKLRESDGYLGSNSVYYQPNHRFYLKGNLQKETFYVTGTFCNWKEGEISMTKTTDGWFKHVYIQEGSYQYKFHSGNFWLYDELNPDKTDDLAGGFNSVLVLGDAQRFFVEGFENAKQVVLTGTFNNWNEGELLMKRVEGGWALDYVIGPGDHQYKFIVDGAWITDPKNAMLLTDDFGNTNSVLIHKPNHTFTLSGFPEAQQVILSGTFNNWAEKCYVMKRVGDTWELAIYLLTGKHQYKFIVDGVWITDPANPLWEENEHSTGNSIYWQQPE
jgi:hypothetical protein